MSPRRYKQLVSTADASPQGRSVVVVIGIDRYRHWQPLANAVSDARGACALFERLGFEVREPLLDDRATGAAIEALVTDELTTLSNDDNLVLFFAGHGSTREQEIGRRQVTTGYLIPVDGEDAGNRVSSWIEVDAWLRRIAKLPPRHILVILDACFSGIVLAPVVRWARGSEPVLHQPFSTLQARQSRKVITSALNDEVAMDCGPLPGHSLFTGCLLEGLTGGIIGVRRGDKLVTTGTELAQYVRRRVQTYPGAPGWRQTPDFGVLDYDERGEMLIPLLGRTDEATTPISDAPKAEAGDTHGESRSAPTDGRWRRRGVLIAAIAATVMTGIAAIAIPDRASTSPPAYAASSAGPGVFEATDTGPRSARAAVIADAQGAPGLDATPASSAERQSLFADNVARMQEPVVNERAPDALAGAAATATTPPVVRTPAATGPTTPQANPASLGSTAKLARGECLADLRVRPRGTQVVRDGRVLGTGSMQAPLPCQTGVVLTFRKTGYKTKKAPVIAMVNGEPVTVRLSRVMHKIKIESTPSGATIVLTGKCSTRDPSGTPQGESIADDEWSASGSGSLAAAIDSFDGCIVKEKVFGVTPKFVRLPEIETSTITLRMPGYKERSANVHPVRDDEVHLTLEKVAR